MSIEKKVSERLNFFLIFVAILKLKKTLMFEINTSQVPMDQTINLHVLSATFILINVRWIFLGLLQARAVILKMRLSF